MNIINDLWVAILGDPFILFFVLAIFGVFVGSLLSMFTPRQWRKPRAFAQAAPNMIVSIGILGTFFGIVIGLLNFEITHIDRSVEELLKGLKIAFISTVAALAASILLKIVSVFSSKYADEGDDSANQFLESLKDVTSAIKDLKRTVDMGFKDAVKNNDKNFETLIEKSDENVTWLSEQIEEGFTTQIEEFRKFADHMSKAFSEAIIEELKAVIREFNEKISEQFGENFKQLNVAVGRLLEWQENYKNQLEEMQKAFATTVEAIAKVEESIGQINTSLTAIPEHLSQMKEAQETLNAALIELNSGLESLAEMQKQAEGAIPAVTDKINALVDDVAAIGDKINDNSKVFAGQLDSAAQGIDVAVTGMGEKIAASLSAQEAAQQAMIASMQGSFDTMATSLAENISTIGGKMEASVNATAQGIDEAVKDMGDKVAASLNAQEEAQKEMIESIQKSLKEMIADIDQTLPKLDEAIQEQIGRAVLALAENLRGITAQFAEDYTPLVNRMQDLMARIDEIQNTSDNRR